jgi:pSer/pThr/pTyr-binding forkhead associated (FHA) protein
MVNGVPVRGEFPLNDGDRLMLGKTEMRVRIVGIE